MIRELESYGARCTCTIRSPKATKPSTSTASSWCRGNNLPKADAIVAAVAHKEFADRSIDQMLAKLSNGGVYVDVKCTADAAGAARARGVNVWRL